MIPGPWSHRVEEALGDLRARDLLRAPRVVDAPDGLRGRVDGREAVLFCSNDYLGLSGHPAVRAAAAEAAERSGLGPRGSPLICGLSRDHAALEEELADFLGAGRTLLFPSGYQANLATLASLAGPDVAVFSDELNHASIVDGCRLAARNGAEVQVYRHGDAEHLEDLLRSSRAERKLVVTDALFSMDGDLAPLGDLVELRRRHGFLLVLDEAHAFLVLGRRGAGAAEALGVEDEVDLRVATLGKAVGSQGGVVAAGERLIEYVTNRGRSYVYSTAPVVPAVAAARAALRVFREDPGLRDRLEGHRATLSAALGESPPGAIFRVVLGSEARALAAAADLLDRGFFVPAVRPPTVPPGTARLRITLSAGHRREEVAALAASLPR